jgi:hypothetical protein
VADARFKENIMKHFREGPGQMTRSNEQVTLVKTKMLAANADDLYDKFYDLAEGYNILSILTAIGMFTVELLRSIDDLEVRRYLCAIIVKMVNDALDDEEKTQTL